MKIDLLITELEPGGAERCCAALALFLHRRGHRVRLLSIGPRPPESLSGLVRKIGAEGIEIIFLDARRSTSALRAARDLRLRVQADPPEIAQAFLWHANVLGAWVYPRLEVPILGGVRVVEPRRLRAWLSGWWSRRMTRIVCVSEEVAQWCRDSERIDPERLVVIPNGIEPVHQPRPDPRTHKNQRILLSVGRLEPQKGIDALLSHVDSLLAALPDHRVVFVGDGSLRSWVERQRQASPYRHRIDLLGRRDDVLDWMSHAEILLHPARYEGMPNVALEAMACGLPIVAFRVEGMAALLGNAFDSQSVPRGDWSAWTGRVVSLANDPERRRSLGESNQQRALTHFRLEDQLARYESLFADVIEAAASRRK